MSRQMQLKVTVQPYYKQDFERAYPRLARYLRTIDPALVEASPALHEIAGRVPELSERLVGTSFHEQLTRHGPQLLEIHDEVERLAAEWELAAADRLLYELEDLFDDIEREL